MMPRPWCFSHMTSTASDPLLGCVPPLQGPAQASACSLRAPETCFYRGPGREGTGFQANPKIGVGTSSPTMASGVS